MTITYRWTGELKQFDNMIKAVGDQAPKALQRAVSRAGDQAKTQVTRALTKQTGLKRKTIVKAIKVTKPSFKDLTYTMESEGGNISVKYFSARETRKGVTASPWGQRKLFAGSFMRGGLFPNRSGLVFGGHAFKRIGKKRRPIEKVKTGLFIPQEMITGATEAVFQRTVADVLPKRVAHELGRLLK